MKFLPRVFGYDGVTKAWDAFCEGARVPVAYFYFVGWSALSLGIHVSLSQPNIEIHLPFGFIRIGFSKIHRVETD